ncbi:WDR55-like protein, partial [Mya arenaria]
EGSSLADKPKDICLEDMIIDIEFHPQKDKSCRVVRFSPSGEDLHAGSKDKSFSTVDLNTGTLKRRVKNAHEAAIYSMLVTGDNFLVTGDDDGYVKLWDLRQQKAVMEERQSEEYISDIAVDDQKKTLLVASGEGTLTAFNLRRKKMETQSELFDSEFLSLAIVKRGQKVVCGCGNGELNMFTWGDWGNISDRFPGHPMSIDCMVPLTDDIVCTGSMDGLIRAVHILPNRFIGIVGEHPGDFPVENLSLSRDKHLLASCSHDQKIKFWNVDSVSSETVDVRTRALKGDKSKFLKSSDKGDFFADLAADEASGNAGGDKKDGDGDDDDGDDSVDDDSDSDEND